MHVQVSAHARDFLKGLLIKDPARHPDIVRVLDHAWMRAAEAAGEDGAGDATPARHVVDVASPAAPRGLDGIRRGRQRTGGARGVREHQGGAHVGGTITGPHAATQRRQRHVGAAPCRCWTQGAVRQFDRDWRVATRVW